MARILLVTNIPPPYRIPVFNLLAQKYGDDFTVIYCARRESNRNWVLPDINHSHVFLKENIKEKNGRYIHNNRDVLSHLNSLKPDIVITTGFNPTFLYAFLWTLLHRKKHIPMTDGTMFSESFLTWKHKLIRKIVYKYSAGFIGASNGSVELYKSYGISGNKIFKSCLCVNNEKFIQNYIPMRFRKYDIMFSGQFIAGKMPNFFIEVAEKLTRIKKDLKVLIIGSGPLESKIIKDLKFYNINYNFQGFMKQESLPHLYANSKILLFPTLCDTWGVVANEACAAGTPVVTCNKAGVADDLIIAGLNGFVLPLDSDIWAKKILKLLGDESACRQMSKVAIQKVKEYNFEIAAEGIVNACKKAIN